MASFVLTQIDAAISLFTSLLQHGARTPRYKSNLQWLLDLRTRALSKISSASTAKQDNPERDADSSHRSNKADGSGDGEDDEDVELLGWRTRLIERAGQGRPKIIRTIRLAETPNDSPTDSQNTDAPNLQLDENYLPGSSDMAFPGAPFSGMPLDSTNDIVRLANEQPMARTDVCL